MRGTDAVELAVVGRRSPEMRRLAETITEHVAAGMESWGEFAEGDVQSPARHPRKKGVVERGGRHGVFRWGAPGESVGLSPADLERVVVVNALTKKGSARPGTVAKLVRDARAREPRRTVIVVLDDESPEAVRAARAAGANEFLSRDDLDNEEVVYWRFRNASLLSRPRRRLKRAVASGPAEVRPLRVRNPVRLSAEELRAADEAIDAAVATLPTAEERRAHGRDVLEVVAPELRDEGSGRLSARSIADATGLSLAALARASGVTQQALSATPDSPSAQAGLLPVARLSVLLDELLLPEHKRAWLQTPHPRFGGRSPVEAIEAGEADLVALSVENALEGHPD